MFSNDGPNLRSPADTKIPKVIPKYKDLKIEKFIPKLSIDIPNKGEVKSIAGTKPINALIKAVKIREKIISFILIGEMNKFVKFLLKFPQEKAC